MSSLEREHWKCSFFVKNPTSRVPATLRMYVTQNGETDRKQPQDL